MDAVAFFLLRYDALHGVITDRAFADLSDGDLRARPHGQNSIVWLVWHIARGEDIGVNRFAYDQREVFDDGDWAGRIGIPRRDLGTSMTSDEVTVLTASADIAALRAYWDAVGRRTMDVLRATDVKSWGDPVDPARMRRIIRDERDYGPRVDVARVETFYAGMTRGWALAHLALTHPFGHFAEANVVRGMLGYPGI